MTLKWIVDGFIVLLYFVGMIAIGLYSSRKKNAGNSAQYFAASGRIPAWAIGMSILATIISSVSFLAYPANAYKGTWLQLVQGLMVPIVLFCVIWVIVPIYRRSIGLSAYEYFERRFSYTARLYTSLAFSVFCFIGTGSVVFLVSQALNQLTGISMDYIIIAVAVVTVAYTLIGGMEAVIWTDVVQGFIFLIGGLACVAILLFRPEGGPSAVVSTAWQGGKIDMGPYKFDLVNGGFWVLAINGVFYAIQKYTTDQTMVQRYLVAKTDKEAEKATLLGAFLCVPTWTMFMFIGSCLWAYYQLVGTGSLPKNADGSVASAMVFPYFIANELPMGLTGLVLAALLAAAMSSLSSDLNSLSAVFVEDYYRRFRPAASDHQRVRVGKIVVGVSGVIATVVALIYVRLDQETPLLERLFAAYAVFAGGLAGLFCLGFLTKRANWQGAICGMVATVLFCAWGYFTGGADPKLNLGRFNFPHHGLMLQVYPHFVMFGVGYLASLAFPAPNLEWERLTLSGFLAKRRSQHTEESAPVS